MRLIREIERSLRETLGAMLALIGLAIVAIGDLLVDLAYWIAGMTRDEGDSKDDDFPDSFA